jgi:hypothetical protein
VESLGALFELFKLRSKVSGYVDGKPTGAYELSHIWPVKGNQYKMGLLHSQNLVLAPARLNRSHGSKTPSEEFEGIGRCLPTDALLDRYSVSKVDSLAQVEKQVFRLLGETWQRFVATLVIQQGQQEQLKKKLEKTLETTLPADLSIEQLKELAGVLKVNYFSANWEPKPESWVLEKELTRLGHVRGTEYGIYSSWLESCFWEVYGLGTGLLDGSTDADEKELEQMLVGEAFAVLHGQPMPPRKANSQELLFLLLTPKKRFKVSQDNEAEVSEEIL